MISSLRIALAGAAMGVAATAMAAGPDRSLTIYSSAQPGGVPAELYRPLPGGGQPNGQAVPGYAMVREDRELRIPSGRSTLPYTDVAAFIDPTTVAFRSLTDPDARVLEQNYQFDLVGTARLLQRYIDKPITVDRGSGPSAGPPLTGTLLSASDGLVLRGADGTIHLLRDYGAVHLAELPGGLITRPTLLWTIDSPKGGEQDVRITYQTAGITWWADYNLTLDEGKDANSATVDLGAWVSIVNQTGASFEDTRLKLIAGDVNRVAPPQRVYMQKRAMEMAVANDQAAGFEQKAFFEFHLYTLGRRTTLPDNSTKQIELFDEARKVPARKQLVYVGAPSYGMFGEPNLEPEAGSSGNRKVDVYLEFDNAKAVGLGMPLPAGRIRVSKLDAADGSLEFIGEDSIDHTPKDEKVRIRMGSAFDVIGERKVVDFSVDSRGRTMEEEIEVTLRNHKDSAVEVLVREPLNRWTQWKVISKSQEFRQEDARTIAFPVRIAKEGEATVRYRVRYSW